MISHIPVQYSFHLSCMVEFFNLGAWQCRTTFPLSPVQVPVSPNFKVVVTLDVIQGGGPNSQFYLIDIGGCWKNDGNPCDGNVDSDVTRYVEMIINPQTANWCRSVQLYPSCCWWLFWCELAWFISSQNLLDSFFLPHSCQLCCKYLCGGADCQALYITFIAGSALHKHH